MVILLLVLIAAVSYPQDPGLQDSIIIETIDVGGVDSAGLRIFVKTDDSVGYYNIPLTFTLIDGEPGFHLTDVNYFPPLTQWDLVYDTVIAEDRYLHMYAQYDTAGGPNPPLNTGYYRMHIWSLNFEFDSLTWSFIEIDTTDNPAYGSLSFRLTDGVTEFTPAFVKGYLYQGLILGNQPEGDLYPTEFSLPQNYPNPFNASTTIEYTLPEAGDVRLSVYNILGQKAAVIFDGIKPAGAHSVTWNPGELPSGVYFARLEIGVNCRAIKMLLLK